LCIRAKVDSCNEKILSFGWYDKRLRWYATSGILSEDRGERGGGEGETEGWREGAGSAVQMTCIKECR
jgi:hypothetical protein